MKRKLMSSIRLVDRYTEVSIVIKQLTINIVIMENQFLFEKTKKNNWPSLMNSMRLCFDNYSKTKYDFEVIIRNYSKKRSSNQLRAYWMLIRIVKDYMNSEGNSFDDKTVSDYFKIHSGHFEVIDDVKIPKSIAFNSGTTRVEMKNIIDAILKFGIDNNIKGCHIESDVLKDLIASYK